MGLKDMKINDMVVVTATKEQLFSVGIDVDDYEPSIIGARVRVSRFYPTGYVEIVWATKEFPELKYDVPFSYLTTLDEIREKNSNDVEKVLKLLDVHDNNIFNITWHDFDRLNEAVKGHMYYEEEDEFEKTIKYIQYSEPYEHEELKHALLGVCSTTFDDLEIETIADLERAELLIKLYNSTSTYEELKGCLKKGVYERL